MRKMMTNKKQESRSRKGAQTVSIPTPCPLF